MKILDKFDDPQPGLLDCNFSCRRLGSSDWRAVTLCVQTIGVVRFLYDYLLACSIREYSLGFEILYGLDDHSSLDGGGGAAIEFFLRVSGCSFL